MKCNNVLYIFPEMQMRNSEYLNECTIEVQDFHDEHQQTDNESDEKTAWEVLHGTTAVTPRLLC